MTELRTLNTYLSLKYLIVLQSRYSVCHSQQRACVNNFPGSMSSKKCSLRQHNRREAATANFKVIDLSLDDTVLKYLLRGPNLLDSHINEDCELYHIDDVAPESGSLAILR